MFEYHIEKALRAGVAQYVADPGRFAHELRAIDGVSADEAAKVEEFIQANPPNVVFQFPRETDRFPIWSIVLAGAEESDAVLGEQTDLLNEEEAAEVGRHAYVGMPRYISQYSFDVAVISYAKNPAVCLWYTRLAQVILTRARHYFTKLNYVNSDIAIADLAPDEGLQPGQLFTRELRFSAQRWDYALDHLLVDSEVQGDLEPPGRVSGVTLTVTDAPTSTTLIDLDV